MEKLTKILVVDDDKNLRETLADLLALEGYHVYQAGNAEECIKLCELERFSVILMDYNLPGKTGMEIIRQIRSFDQETQIIMITAYASLNAVMQALQESVYDFLIKPVDFDYLKRTLVKALEKYKLQQKNLELVKQLQVHNADLDRLNNMKSKFFSVVSHDLSNSLVTLKMGFDAIAKRLEKEAESKRKVYIMSESIAQMEHLIKDLVDWAAIEKGKLRIEKKDFELVSTVAQIVELFQLKATEKQIKLNFNSKEKEIFVHADVKRIRQVISNLLENAIRHTPESGKISIQIGKADKKNVKVCIVDSGDGIDSGKALQLFDSFIQVGEKEKVGRLGLGLSIAKEIITSHDGSIWAESEGLGKGAMFAFVLPIESL